MSRKSENAQMIAPKTLGGHLPRIDGAYKVTGTAIYTSDISFDGMLYAVPICCTIPSGTILSIETGAALAMPGVKAIFTRGDIGPFYWPVPAKGLSGRVDERRPALDDDIIRYYGQYAGVAVAQTFEQSTAAARAVTIKYSASPFDVGSTLSTAEPLRLESIRGVPEQAFASAPIQVDHVYTTPVETHNPIELHATVAVWEDDESVTLYETSQAVVNHRIVLAQVLGLRQDQVRVISHFLGSGFGSKLWPWSHSALAAGAARKLRVPVKLVLDRKMMFQTVGHRARTQQRMRLGATANGKLVSLQQDYLSHASMLDEYIEECGRPTPFLYSTPNLAVRSAAVHQNVGSPTSMRGPGAVPGLFAIESAMDELAVKLNLDPVQLRIINEPSIDEERNIPFSSRHLRECIETGAKRFGWENRKPQPGSMKRGGLTLGWGMAACTWDARRFDAEASVQLTVDGIARVATNTQDIGTGMYTALAVIVSELTGLPVERIEVSLGDSLLPPGPLSGGSRATASVVPAVMEATRGAIQAALEAATAAPNPLFPRVRVEDLWFQEGKIGLKIDPPESGVPYTNALRRSGLAFAAGSGRSGATEQSEEGRKYSINSFGAHFCEVTWQPEIARLRVSRFVSVIDGGRILNPVPARNQIEGAVVMGIGMALFEATHYDARYGAPLNSNLADYMLTTNGDAPQIDASFVEYPDTVLNELGVRGIGEIGLAGAAAAIASAVWHATGVRVRNLPIRIEDLMKTPA
jgi:xanthine dehydrogenase YagR molybdenum-binding subunit